MAFTLCCIIKQRYCKKLQKEQSMDSIIEFKDLRGFFRRRKKIIIITFILIFGIIGSRAVLLPSIYRSQAMIQIEGQQIPPDYIKSTVSSYAEERLRMITRQIMTRTKLLEIINKFDLYPNSRGKITTQKLIEKISNDISLEPIIGDVIDKKTGRQRDATIAFILSYEGTDPNKVFQVTQDLATLYLKEDERKREQLTTSATSFFQNEADQLKGQIYTLENNISDFKKSHIGELPENNTVNLQAIARLQTDFDRINLNINSLQERIILLKQQIKSVDPLSPVVTNEGKIAMNPRERLKKLHLELVNMQSVLSNKHPDVKKLKRQIKELEDQVKQSDKSEFKIRRLSQLEGQLASLRGELGSKHPDVIRLSKEANALSIEIDKQAKKSTSSPDNAENPDNPAYINLKIQILSAETELKGLVKEKERIESAIRGYRKKIETSPLVEKEYSKLIRDYETAQLKYNEIMNKLMEARVAQGMEKTQRADRFTLVEPPSIPEIPYKPNRMAIALIGLALALGSSGGLAIARETMDNSVKTADELSEIMDGPVLSVLALVETAEEKRARRTKRIFWIFAFLVLLVGASILTHRFIIPLDPFFAKIQSKLMSLGISFGIPHV